MHCNTLPYALLLLRYTNYTVSGSCVLSAERRLLLQGSFHPHLIHIFEHARIALICLVEMRRTHPVPCRQRQLNDAVCPRAACLAPLAFQPQAPRQPRGTFLVEPSHHDGSEPFRTDGVIRYALFVAAASCWDKAGIFVQ